LERYYQLGEWAMSTIQAVTAWEQNAGSNLASTRLANRKLALVTATVENGDFLQVVPKVSTLYRQASKQVGIFGDEATVWNSGFSLLAFLRDDGFSPRFHRRRSTLGL
jgi:hypothetical protein